MKKILLLPVLFALGISACIKKDATISTTVTASYPTITLSQEYFSVEVNALYPTVTATVTDSFYNPCTVVPIDSAIHTNVAGLYVGDVAAENTKGYISYADFYVAVTDISDSLNLSGVWWPADTTTDIYATTITELANGLYMSTNMGALADTPTTASFVSGIFAVINTTTIVFPANNTTYGSSGALSMIPGDTTISYTNANTGAVVTFKKQN